MVGKIFITRTGFDPEFGKLVKDPYLGDCPSMGACRPDIRRKLVRGDQIFVVSGKVAGASQFVLGGFEIEEKITAFEAYERYPGQRLHRLNNGQVAGNIIVDRQGHQHRLDDHNSFEKRVQHYIVGTNPIALETHEEIAEGREQTLEVLCDVLKKKSDSPFGLLGRSGASLSENQVLKLRDWLSGIKESVQ